MHLRAISESAALATDGNFLKTQVLGSISEMPVSHLVITVVYFTNSTSVSISVVIKYADKSNLKGGMCCSGSQFKAIKKRSKRRSCLTCLAYWDPYSGSRSNECMPLLSTTSPLAQSWIPPKEWCHKQREGSPISINTIEINPYKHD